MWHVANVATRKQVSTALCTFSMATSEVREATSEVAGRTYVAVGNVQQVFDPTAFGVAQLIAQRLLNNDVVSLVGGQDLVDVLCRSQSVHLMSLLENTSSK